ncbi:MAG: hypothetical protein methR_P3316 [Methyloprofundus sp.]|nr:MAG: hypothetical protein methR_P3316 [Methyloprofundus sp.]
MKIKKICASVTLILASSVQAAPVQWAENNHWYEFVSTPTYITDARIDALGREHAGNSGYLVTILSQEEQDFVKSLADRSRAWIGASDNLTEGIWEWMDGPEAGQELIYSFWAPGEPNDYNRLGEDYAALNWQRGTGRWNDWGGPQYTNVHIGYIVEYSESLANAANVPAPITVAMLGLGLLGFTFSKRKSIPQTVVI